MLHDYTSVTAESVADVTEAAITEAESLLDAVIQVDGDRTYTNTVAPLDTVGVLVSDASGGGSFMAKVHPDAGVRAAGVAAGERTSKWAADLMMRPDLAAAVRAYAAANDAAALEDLEARNLVFWLRDLRRAGHDLAEGDQARLRELRQRLIETAVTGATREHGDLSLQIDHVGSRRVPRVLQLRSRGRDEHVVHRRAVDPATKGCL